MRLLVSTLALWCLLAVTAFAQNGPGSAPPSDPKSAATIGSYGAGINIGRRMKADGVDVNLEAITQGIRDGLQGAPSRYTEDQIRAAWEVIGRQAQARQPQGNLAAAEQNLRAGHAFLAANKAKPGVVALPSGLQYEVLQAGTGPTPRASDTVKVHYQGTLLDGTIFDSSIKRNEPVTFPVNGVIPGWTEALLRMKVGDHWRLVIPSDLAYGAQGVPRAGIGPHSVLLFDVQLLGIEPPGR
jgi:FKBP-type peptidyl-prolyl cis-trans isomerase FklB